MELRNCGSVEVCKNLKLKKGEWISKMILKSAQNRVTFRAYKFLSHEFVRLFLFRYNVINQLFYT